MQPGNRITFLLWFTPHGGFKEVLLSENLGPLNHVGYTICAIFLVEAKRVW